MIKENTKHKKMVPKYTTFLLLLTVKCAMVLCNDQDDVSFKVLTPSGECDQKVEDGNKVSVHFIGWLKDGTEFENTYHYDTPFHFNVGSKKVPVGLSRGVKGMCVGEIREIDVPPHLGYGDEGKDKIPGGSWLLYEVEVVDMSDKDIDMFEALDEDKDERLTSEELKKYFTLPDVAEIFGETTPDENGIAFLTQTIMNIGDVDGDDALTRDEFYAIEDFQKHQQREKEENETEFREDL